MKDDDQPTPGRCWVLRRIETAVGVGGLVVFDVCVQHGTRHLPWRPRWTTKQPVRCRLDGGVAQRREQGWKWDGMGMCSAGSWEHCSGRKLGVPPSRRSPEKIGQDKARKEPSPPCVLLWCVLIFTGVIKVQDASVSVQLLNFRIRREGFPFYQPLRWCDRELSLVHQITASSMSALDPPAKICTTDLGRRRTDHRPTTSTMWCRLTSETACTRWCPTSIRPR